MHLINYAIWPETIHSIILCTVASQSDAAVQLDVDDDAYHTKLRMLRGLERCTNVC